MFIRNHTQVMRFFQASLASGGTVQISLMREYWVVYVSLTGINGPDGEIGEGPEGVSFKTKCLQTLM